MQIKTLLILAAFCTGPGCSSAPERTRPSLPKHSIAVLPFANQSNDLEAPERIRKILFHEMVSRGWQMIGLEKIDGAMKDLGISEGGQLNAVSVEELREKIPADRFLYGTLVDFVFKSIGVISQRRVEVEISLVDSVTGESIWKGSECGVTSRAGMDAAGDLAVTVAGKIFKSVKDGTKKLLPGKTLKKTADFIDEMADVELKTETSEAIRKLLDRIEGDNP